MDLLSLILTFSLVIGSSAAALGSSRKAFLDAHNLARAAAGMAPMVWDAAVANCAMKYAKERIGDCALEHSQGGPYAENIAKGGQLSEVDAVNMWVGEKQYYDPASKRCRPGQECGHYLNVVATLSTRLGCARVTCANSWIFIICDYAAAAASTRRI